MKKNNLLFAFCLLIFQFGFCQQAQREILHGNISVDSVGVSVENVTITNHTSDRSSVSDRQGDFDIYARENDTLYVTSQSFDTKKIVLKAVDFKVKVWRVKMETFVNPLNEVKINRHELTGNLEADQKNIKVLAKQTLNVNSFSMQLPTADQKTSPTNKIMPGYVDRTFMPDFMKIGSKVARLLGSKPKGKKPVFVSDKNFSVAVQERLSKRFFTDDLQLNQDEIGLFLTYCESDSIARSLLDPKKEFDLIVFLKSKIESYKTLNKD